MDDHLTLRCVGKPRVRAITVVVFFVFLAVSFTSVGLAYSSHVEFSDGIYSETRGDVATITVDTDGGAATIVIGSDEVGFQANVTVSDGGDFDDEVTIRFNTLRSAEGAAAFSTPDGSSDEVTSVTIVNGVSNVVAPIRYPLRVWEGEEPSGISDDQAVLIVEDRPALNLTTSIAPSEASIDNAESLDSVSLTQANRTARGNWLILALGQLPGMEGYLSSRQAFSQSRSDRLFRILTTSQGPYRLHITQVNPPINREPIDLDSALSSRNTRVIIDDQNNVYIAFKPTNDLVDGTLSGVYEIRLEVTGFDNAPGFIESSTSVSRRVEFGAPTVSFISKDAFAVRDGKISGRSNLAPGTKITVTVATKEGVIPPFEARRTVEIQNNQRWSVSFDFSDLSEGDKYKIKVTSDVGVNKSATGTIRVDNPPIARFDYTPRHPKPEEKINLTAFSSVDDGKIVSYEWDTDGDGSYGEYGEPTGPNITISFGTDGTHEVGLRVTDNGGNTNVTRKVLNITNTPPRAAFEYTVDASGDLEVSVNASAASDPDGRIVEYEWYVDGDYNGDGLTQGFEFFDKGAYEIKLVVTDNGGAQSELTKTVGVSTPPVAQITLERDLIGTNRPVKLSATKSKDPDGTIRRYTWRVNGTTLSGEQVTTSFTEPGIYNVTLVVTDGTGQTSTTNTSIEVVSPPNVSVSWTPEEPADNAEVTFTANTTGEVSEYIWDFDGNGESEKTGQVVTHRFPEGGQYTVRLTVTSPRGISTTIKRTVTVRSVEPTVNVSWRPNGPRSGQDVVFTAESSTQIVSYKWDFDGDGKTDKTGRTVTYAFPSTGTQVVELTATDRFGDSVTVRKVVTIQKNATFELSTTQSEATVGDTVVVNFRANNRIPDTPIYVKLSLELPESGVGISSISGATLASRSSTQFIKIRGGGATQISLRLQLNNNASYNISANAVYYIGSTDSDNRRSVSVNSIKIEVKSQPTPTATLTETETTSGVTTESSPGMTVISMVTALVSVCVVLLRRLT